MPPSPPLLSRPVPVLRHLRSAITWNVGDTAVPVREQQRLVSAGIGQPRVWALLSWRRAALTATLPVLLLTLALSVTEVAGVQTDFFTGLGVLVMWLPAAGLAVLAIGVASTVAGWARLRGPSRVLIACWVASVVLPLLAALAPIDVVLDVEALRAQAVSAEEVADVQLLISGGRLGMAIGYALNLFAVVISVPAGALKGAWRIKSLLPSTSLPGWFLVAVAPFYSLFLVVLFVLINQVAGNALLLVGIAALALVPWMFVVHRRTYSRPLSQDQARRDLPRAAVPARLLLLAGVVLVTVFLVTAEVDGTPVLGWDAEGALFTYLSVGQVLLEVIGRSVVTSVVFCMILLAMTLAQWRSEQQIPPPLRSERDAQCWAFDADAGPAGRC